MSFGNFLRKLSFESDRSTHVTGTTDPAEHTGMSSIFAAPGKLFDSVNAKTGHLVSDLNQKLDLSGKLDTLKQVSVNKFEHVVHGSPTRKETRPDECTTDMPPRAPLSNPFNKADPTSNLSGTNTETEKSNPSLRRQSTHTSANRPPRPPPPTAAALSRAMSLDETNLSKHIPKEQKAGKRAILTPKLEPSSELDEERSIQHAQDKEDGREFISLDQNRHSYKLSDDDGDSSASEYGAHGDQPVYMPEQVTTVRPPTEEQEQMGDAGFTSTELSDDLGSVQLNAFMDLCVSALLSGRWNEVYQHDSELQSLLQTSSGRMAFVNQMEQESVRTEGLIAADGLAVLLEKIGYLLNECQDAEDFAPARKILTSSLLYYVEDPSRSTERTSLFSYIKPEPIWHTLRFWNACFFQSVQEARAKLAEKNQSDLKRPEEIVFDQLKSYLNTMNVFELHTTIKQEFLRKHSGLFNLTDEEIQTLRGILQDEN